MISENGVFALEQFVLAKYYIATQVYRHKIRLITDQMIVRAITLGITKDTIEELYTLYHCCPKKKEERSCNTLLNSYLSST
jgi:HD superfamily phosphohydrolase